MSQLNVHLNFNGQCEAAFNFYVKNLNAKIDTLSRWGESPMGKDSPSEMKDKIIHGSIRIGEQMVMGGDAPQGYYEKPAGFTVMLTFSSKEEAERVFTVLSQNGHIRMPLAETYWAKVFGMCIDQFGIPWGINCLKPM